MRTTLDIDDDLLAAAKELARREGSPIGTVVSRLLRQALFAVSTPPVAQVRKPVGGLVPFPARPGIVVTQAHVAAVRDEEGI